MRVLSKCRFFFPGGGDVMERYSVIIKEGLGNAGYEIATKYIRRIGGLIQKVMRGAETIS
jgi:hypothetical protein